MMRRYDSEPKNAHCDEGASCSGYTCRNMVAAVDDGGVPTMCGTSDRGSTCEHGNRRYCCRECKEGGTGGGGICEHDKDRYSNTT